MRLTYKHNQEHHFKIICYPDGQKSVELDLEYFNDKKSLMKIECSVRNFDELEVLISLVAALRKNDFCINLLKFNYLFGMRSDRSFAEGQPNYFRDVLAPIINMLNIPEVGIVHPHNDLILSYINNSYTSIITNFISFKDMIGVGADKSAVHREDRDDLYFIKVRNGENIYSRLSKNSIQNIEDKKCKNILVYDDLCDGGATFIAAADFLRETFLEHSRYLYITHGLFTKGIDHVADHYEKIYVTNSYQEFDHPKVQVINVWGE